MNSHYLIKRSVDVFHSGRILPLVHGKGAFKSKKPKLLTFKSDLTNALTSFSKYGLKSGTRQNFFQFSRNLSQNKEKNIKIPKIQKMIQKPIQFYGIKQDSNVSEKKYKKLKTSRTLAFSIEKKEKTIVLSEQNILKKQKNFDFNEMIVFENFEEVRNLRIQKSFSNLNNLKTCITKDLNFQKNNFKNLQIIMSKFLQKKPLESDEIKTLSKFEKSLFMIYINKKKDKDHQISSLCEKNLKDLNDDWVGKSPNNDLHYVLNNVVNLMKKHFKKYVFLQLKPFLKAKYRNLSEKAQFEYCFFGFYFMEARSSIPRKIEEYFLPKSKNLPDIRNSYLIPDYITLNYFKLLKKCGFFMKHFRIIVKDYLFLEVKQIASNWLIKECKRVTSKLRKEGEVQVIREIRERYRKNIRTKFPWGIQEVQKAIQSVLSI